MKSAIFLFLCTCFFGMHENIGHQSIESKHRDSIVINNQSYALEVSPLCLVDSINYKSLYNVPFLSENYYCIWSIQSGKMYLDKIKVFQFEGNEIVMKWNGTSFEEKTVYNNPHYSDKDIYVKMQEFTGGKFDKGNRMFAKFISGNIYIMPNKTQSQHGNIRCKLTIKKGKVTSPIFCKIDY
ncbi:MAG: hypothetical protein J6C18_02595 [Bacteroidaceae bacterium]|nr:hypothetical protein [Bacteroidaceae bacterium]